MNALRRLARKVAHNNMKKAGYYRINKGDFFSKHWREFVLYKED